MYAAKAISILDDLLANAPEYSLSQNQRLALAYAINNALLPLKREQELIPTDEQILESRKGLRLRDLQYDAWLKERGL